MNQEEVKLTDHQALNIQSLSYVLVLGGIVGCMDPLLDLEFGIRAKIAFVAGTVLILLVPFLRWTQSITLTMLIALIDVGLCFMTCYTLSGQPLFLAYAMAAPIAAAMFLRFPWAIAVLCGYAICSLGAAMTIHFGLWMPPMNPAAMTRGYIGEGISLSLIAAALSVPAIWKELRIRKALNQEAQSLRSAKRHRQRFVHVMNHAFAGFLDVSPEGNIVAIHGALFETLGYSQSELHGKPLRSLIHRGAEQWDSLLRSTVEKCDSVSPQKTLSQEVQLIARDGSLRWVGISAMRIDDAISWKVVAAIRDLEEEMLSRTRLQEVSRIEGLATVCAGLAHDFNNVLTVFGLLFENVDDDRLRREMLTAHTQARELTAGLLDFATRRESVDDVTEIRSFLSDFQPIAERLAGAAIDCHWLIQCPPTTLPIQKTKLQQVFVNLVTNAKHAMPDGGILKILIGIENSSSSSRAGTYLQLEVADNGHGMDDETRIHAIEPFFTTKPRGRGTGLGLSTSHGIIASVGGKMDIRSDVGVGTSVSMLIPVVEVDEEFRESNPEEALQKPDDPGIFDDIHVAIVEDRDILAVSLKRMLSIAGYSTDVYSCAEDLLESGHVEKIDVLLSDVELPGMNGIALANEVVLRNPEVRVLLTSGHRQNDIEHFQRDGLTRFLPKPFNFEQLAAALKDLHDQPVSTR